VAGAGPPRAGAVAGLEAAGPGDGLPREPPAWAEETSTTLISTALTTPDKRWRPRRLSIGGHCFRGPAFAQTHDSSLGLD
jgi:hypothetical protein